MKELCSYLKNANGISNKDLVFSEFFHSIKDGFDESIVNGFNGDCLSGLDIHSLCHVLAVYEYILHELKISDNEILFKYDGVRCPKEDNVIYITLLGCFSDEVASGLYTEYLENSIEPFKSRGIIASEFNYAV